MVIAFDFDGTLGASFGLICYCMAETLKKYDIVYDREALFKYFGPTEKGILIRILGKEKGEKAFKEFLKCYEENHTKYLPKLFFGVKRTLKYLKRHHITTILLTGRSLETSLISFKYFNIDQYFDSVFAGSIEGVNKPENLSLAAKKYNISKEELIYIGDSSKDIESCKIAGVKLLSLTFHNKKKKARFADLNPGNIYLNYFQLLRRIKKEIKNHQ